MLSRIPIWRGGLAAIAFVALAVWTAWAVETAPKADQMRIMMTSAKIQQDGASAQGKCLFPLHVDEKDTSKPFRQVLLGAEDSEFYQHRFGVSERGMLYAALTLGSHRGGSTITQQLVKNILFEPGDNRWKRKALELPWAIIMNSRFSKSELLTAYLNNIPFRHGIYGVQAASYYYFGKPVSALNYLESAEMEVMLSNPRTDLDGGDSRVASTRTKAKNLLLALIRRKIIPFSAQKDREAVADADAPDVDCGYVRDFALREIQREHWMTKTPGAYRIFLTVDPIRQYAARKAVDSVIDDLERKQGSEVSIVDLDRSGRIAALQGGADYEISQFDRASQSRRSPGSLAKIFVLAEACEQGKTLKSIVHDVAFSSGRPRNYDGKYKGDIPLRVAFMESRNAAFVRLAEELGAAKVADRARAFGVPGPFPTGGEIALGQFEASPLQLTAAVAAIANGGRLVHPYAVAGMSGSYGQLSHWRDWSSPGARAVSERCAKMVDSAMREVVAMGTGRKADVERARGKTGTTNDYKDAWFVGYAQPAIVGVWVGNDDNRLAMTNVTGGEIPAQAFRNYMLAINTTPTRKRGQNPIKFTPKPIAGAPSILNLQQLSQNSLLAIHQE